MATPDIQTLLADMVAIESVNPNFPGGLRAERDMAEYVTHYAINAGLEVKWEEVVDGRTNVVIELRVPGAARTLLLDSHTDTVSLDQMGPEGLRPTVHDGRMTGRGSCDDKASLAAMLVAIKNLAANPVGLQSNVTMLASADEEFLMRGAGAFAASGRQIDGAIVGEPTNLEAVVAHKGVLRWFMHAHGTAAHSSNPQLGVNAIYQMAAFLQEIRTMYEPLLKTHTHPLLTPATWSVGKIWGGAAVNIVPELVTVEVDRRLLPGENQASALAEFDDALQKVLAKHPEWRITRDEPYLYAAPVSISSEAPLARAVRAGAASIRGASEPIGVAYGTNASKFTEFGIPCVVLGPGDIRQAHTSNEYVDLAQVEAAARIYEAAARAF